MTFPFSFQVIFSLYSAYFIRSPTLRLLLPRRPVAT